MAGCLTVDHRSLSDFSIEKEGKSRRDEILTSQMMLLNGLVCSFSPLG